ncbi:hypothetical protein Pan44_49010 [Caulifigura coniformis]|uniref:Copper resistance protein D n=1 Tax=Caulifigura coniformis TaxID=2527983 RepID=A0A517SL43_9PLAN|nr:hypothetical protein [Caulifigura coniformis]QDT56841.1 hypothetical protein Pan44_49010 [Caulifigura coniformis]
MSLDVYSRWFHIWFAAVLLGGAVFQWFALGPAVKDLSEEQKPLFREWINARWRLVVMLGSLILLITGLYNYLVVLRPLHKGDGIYHMLMGFKILLALAVFFFASVLAGRSPKFEKMRRRSGAWNLVLIGLLTAIVALGGYLKVARPPVIAPVPAPAVPPAEPAAA